jgi:RNA polymerase sigma factor (sigma-70 family)
MPWGRSLICKILERVVKIKAYSLVQGARVGAERNDCKCFDFLAKEGVLTKQELLPTRASLLERLKNFGAEESWSQFFNLYWKLIYNAACRYELSDAEAQEVVQETMLAVNKHIRSFKYDPARGSFKGWLMTLTRSRIVAQLRRRRNWISIEESGEIVDPFSFQRFWEKEWKENLISVAIERARKNATTRAFQIYSYCVLQEHGPKNTAAALKLSLPAVYLATHKFNRILKREIKRISEKSRDLW